MKNIFILFLFAFSFNSYSQLISENKDYVLVDSIDLTKEEIYSKTKYFIADAWVSANNVIQLDDKENGVILLKGTKVASIFWTVMRTYEYKYYFDYTIEFRMIDGKYKISIKNINNSKSYLVGTNIEYKKLYLSYNSMENCVSSMEPPKKHIINEMLELDKFFNSLLMEYKNALDSKVLDFEDGF